MVLIYAIVCRVLASVIVTTLIDQMQMNHMVINRTDWRWQVVEVVLSFSLLMPILVAMPD